MNKKSSSLWLLLNKILSGDEHQIKWKNPPSKHCAYEPTEIEHIANIISHGFLILPSALASMLLYMKSKTYDHQLVSIIYGSALVLLFSISFAYHWVFYKNNNVIMKDILHRLDRAMIYIFIAGSYYPWLTLENFKYPSIATFLRWLIWVLALIGVLYQQIFHERYKCVETIFYILIGLTPAIILVTVYGHEFIAMVELEIGGIFYFVGVIFFKSDGKLSCAHAIWHLFVGIAAAIHYFAILNHLYVSAAEQ
ncbi:hypothetical protein PVAND_003967 [Polypedilum vanderplanki]|uniref:Uncharacterized protein n=1 Tax=Polypedilum vanderplanki TaxID=319348 RepID=A0A9J6BWQ5_POLVA|nr:hypothetical protein PVAND_003967 [Polypedilum vanderplanki]